MENMDRVAKAAQTFVYAGAIGLFLFGVLVGVLAALALT